MMMSDDQRISAARAALLRPPSARSGVPPFIVMDVIAEAARREASGQRILHMEVGQPGTPAPRIVREAVKRAIDTETLGYTEALGRPALRERISRHYRDWYGLDVAAHRIVVTTGSSAAFVLAFLALFEPGDRVLLPSPGYPCYRHILSALGIGTGFIETGPQDRWMPRAQAVTRAFAATPRPAGLLLASPSNPTGAMADLTRLRELAASCTHAGAWFISDEIYHGLTYEAAAHTALEVSGDVIVINSFSKYFSMTGWRIGWMVVPDGLVRTVERLAQNLYISAPGVSQAAALAAFDAHEELEENRKVYAANRALLLAELPAAGLREIVPADGAFYLYVDISSLAIDSGSFARMMLEETGVAATPGIDFDPERGQSFVRFSYAGRSADIAEAAARLRSWRRLSSRDFA